MNYKDFTLDQCILFYNAGKIACECNADRQIVIFIKEEE